MQYSVRHRRRLRPTTGEHTAAAARATEVAAMSAEGSTSMAQPASRPLVTETVSARNVSRLLASSARR